MENGQMVQSWSKTTVRNEMAHVQEVVKSAQEELQTLLRQRAEIMKRIGTVKQTIAGLANLFGDEVLNEELLQLVDRKSNGRQPGFTKACRMILMEAGRAMSARDICDYFQQNMPALLAHHKDPMASVTTVLNRLVDYGEAQAVSTNNGRRAWKWVAEPNNEAVAGPVAKLAAVS
jgi:chorismate mutase